jgi:aminomethyltransferase
LNIPELSSHPDEKLDITFPFTFRSVRTRTTNIDAMSNSLLRQTMKGRGPMSRVLSHTVRCSSSFTSEFSEFPIAASARIRKSPFFNKTLEHGVAGFTSYNHMLMPTGFKAGASTEYNALTEGVAIWDVAAERQVELKGPDAAKLAQLLTCRDISNIQTGKCVYAVMSDNDGNLVNDPVLLKLADDHFWFSIADSDVRLWAKGIGIGYGLDCKVTEPDVSPLAIQGPNSYDVVCEIFGSDVVDNLGYFDFARGEETMIQVEGKEAIPTLLAESGWSPEKGYEIYLEDGSRGDELWNLVWAAGEKYGIKPGAPNQQRRIEGGMLSFGADTLPDSNCMELGLPKRFVNPFGEHDFVGKEALQKIANNGVKRSLTGIKFTHEDSERIHPSSFWRGQHLPMHAEGQKIGYLTAFSTSPMFGRNLGLGMVDKEFAAAGTLVGVTLPDGVVLQAEMAKAPFVDAEQGLVGGRVKGDKKTARSPVPKAVAA